MQLNPYQKQPRPELQCILNICQFPTVWMIQHQGLMAREQTPYRKEMENKINLHILSARVIIRIIILNLSCDDDIVAFTSDFPFKQ